MKKTLLAISLFALPVSASLAASYTLDPSHTYPNFEIDHLGFSTMHGRFGSTSGTMEFDPAAKKASVSLEIDAASIDTGHQKRDDHLRSPDFLNVNEFPTITFESTGVKWNGDKPGSVTGDLTIMGVTKPITLQIVAMNCGVHPFNKKELCGFDAEGTLKRSDFGVNYGIPAIGEMMKLKIEVEAFKD